MKKKKSLVIILSIILVISIAGCFFLLSYIKKLQETTTYFLSSDSQYVTVYQKDGTEAYLIRGKEVEVRDYPTKINDQELHRFEYDNQVYYVDENHLETDRENCVKEEYIYSLRDTVAYKYFDSYEINGWIKKNTKLNILGYNSLNDEGLVDYYYVSDGQGEGYIDSCFLAYEYVDQSLDASIYSDFPNYGGGDAGKISYYPKDEIHFEDNVMPDVVKALYLNGDSISKLDSYLEIANDCGINAFVLDIKDCFLDTQFGYESEVAKKYSPSTNWFCNSYEDYKNAVMTLRDKGYYVIGRITAFKDTVFASDHFEESLQYEGDYYRYAGVNWPSVYSRYTWEYDVALALEAADIGFNEIQFDYIRCPERIIKGAETHNLYDETYIEAITNFLHYASYQLHKKHVYLSGDVFGETSGFDSDKVDCFVTTYGQFWPAISNVVDVISSMPYPDHFGDNAFGVSKPWENPYDIMYNWGKATALCQAITYTPAKVRTWILAQYSDSYDVDYDVVKVEDQIRALENAGVNDGYMTWSAASSLGKYQSYKTAFK